MSSTFTQSVETVLGLDGRPIDDPPQGGSGLLPRHSLPQTNPVTGSPVVTLDKDNLPLGSLTPGGSRRIVNGGGGGGGDNGGGGGGGIDSEDDENGGNGVNQEALYELKRYKRKFEKLEQSCRHNMKMAEVAKHSKLSVKRSISKNFTII